MLDGFWIALGSILERFGAKLEAKLGPSWTKLTNLSASSSWAKLGPCWGYVGALGAKLTYKMHKKLSSNFEWIFDKFLIGFNRF